MVTQHPARRYRCPGRRLAMKMIVFLALCGLLGAASVGWAVDPAHKTADSTRAAKMPGSRALYQQAHDVRLARLREQPFTHQFPAGVLVSIQREAEAEARRAPDERRARPGRFCGASSFIGVGPAPLRSPTDIFAPSKDVARTQFTKYPVLELSINLTTCAGDPLESHTQSVHEVQNLENSFEGMREVFPFIPEGEVWTLTIPATLMYGAQSIDMIGLPDFCLVTMEVRVENVWSERLPTEACRARLNEVMGYDVAARDAERAAAEERTTTTEPPSTEDSTQKQAKREEGTHRRDDEDDHGDL